MKSILKEKIYLPDMAIACALGIGKKEVAKSLFDYKANDHQKREKLISGKRIPVAPLPDKLKDMPERFKSFKSRNNQVCYTLLEELMPTIKLIKDKYDKNRIGVVVATSTSGMSEGEVAYSQKLCQGHWPRGYNYTLQESSNLSDFVKQAIDIRGPSYTISTSCASGSQAIFAACRLLQAGVCDAVITGGVDTLCQLTLNGFDSLELLSDEVCKPFGRNRNGITLGEGGALFVLTKETMISDTEIVLKGYGESSDAYHLSAPDPNGQGITRAISSALKMADLEPVEIDYINLHGTASKLNDEVEGQSVSKIFGSDVPCSSTKAVTGHTLGAAGAIEAGFLWLGINHMLSADSLCLPPHYCDDIIDDEFTELSFVTVDSKNLKKKNKISLMSNSLAFGGSNASIILGLDE